MSFTAKPTVDVSQPSVQTCPSLLGWHERVHTVQATCLCLQSGPSYVEAFLTVLKNVTKDETVQYVLALVEEMLAGGWAAGGR
jgi:hypothetical protein